MEVILFFLALGAGALGLWLLAMTLQVLFGIFLAMLAFITMIVTGRWFWKFINEDDDEQEKPVNPK